MWSAKSPWVIAGIFGALKAGACYVPLDPQAPHARVSAIIRDSGMRALLISAAKLKHVPTVLSGGSSVETVVLLDQDGDDSHSPDGAVLALPASGPVLAGGEGATTWDQGDASSATPSVVTRREVDEAPCAPLSTPVIEPDLAYILYTSGSTGTPKGVMLSHRASLTFVNWATACARLTPDDRLSNHAALHFDLSTFDIFGAVKAAATVVMIPEGASVFPSQLADLIERERISVWYSVPSALTLLVLYGNLAAHDLGCCRLLIFAGEVFPVKYLQQLMKAMPHARLLNWYGPTETNVCTWYEVQESDASRTTPVPIGRACSNTEVFIVGEDGWVVKEPGQEGELCVRGPSLMKGYWGDAEKTRSVLTPSPLAHHFQDPVYRTGDLVTLSTAGDHIYLGRRDGQIKTRGYRVELGEIEAALYRHSAVKEAVVLAVPDDILTNRLRAVVSLHDGWPSTAEDLIAFCRLELPLYMVPDSVELLPNLPKTSTGKTDRTLLAAGSSGSPE